MSNEVAQQHHGGGDVIEAVIIKGDLSKLTPQERVSYYKRVCESVGLNPFTRPLAYINLNGQLRLYALRDCADQLRKLHGISIEIVDQKVEHDLISVHVRANDKTGRKDEDFGVVTIAGLRGEARANAQLKAITKAKRRVTLSIAGLGFLDETEVDDIPQRERRAPPSDTIEVLDEFASEAGDTPRDLRAEGRTAALLGIETFREFWRGLSPGERAGLERDLPEFERAAKAADAPLVQEEPGAVEP